MIRLAFFPFFFGKESMIFFFLERDRKEGDEGSRIRGQGRNEQPWYESLNYIFISPYKFSFFFSS